jgi:hypothetical protein
MSIRLVRIPRPLQELCHLTILALTRERRNCQLTTGRDQHAPLVGLQRRLAGLPAEFNHDKARGFQNCKGFQGGRRLLVEHLVRREPHSVRPLDSLARYSQAKGREELFKRQSTFSN